MHSFVRLPSKWILSTGLKQFSWKNDKSDNTAALMALVGIAHHTDQETGVAKLTYEELCAAVDISRDKLAAGIRLLQRYGIVAPWFDGRSTYKLTNFDPKKGYCFIPAKPLYAGETVGAFRQFHLRNKNEMNAMKLYLLFAAQRDRRTNLAHVGFEKIVDYTGVRREDIPAAKSILSSLPLVYTETFPSSITDSGVTSAYRLVGLETKKHKGTLGEAMSEYVADRERAENSGGKT